MQSADIHVRIDKHFNQSQAFGITVMEIFLKGGTPYETMGLEEVMSYVAAGSRIEKPEICPMQIYVEMSKCWASEPTDRPAFDQLAAFFASVSGASPFDSPLAVQLIKSIMDEEEITEIEDSGAEILEEMLRAETSNNKYPDTASQKPPKKNQVAPAAELGPGPPRSGHPPKASRVSVIEADYLVQGTSTADSTPQYLVQADGAGPVEYVVPGDGTAAADGTAEYVVQGTGDTAADGARAEPVYQVPNNAAADDAAEYVVQGAGGTAAVDGVRAEPVYQVPDNASAADPAAATPVEYAVPTEAGLPPLAGQNERAL